MEEQRERGRKGQKKEKSVSKKGELKPNQRSFLGTIFLETESGCRNGFSRVKSSVELSIVSIKRHFTQRWAGKPEIADCFMCRGHDRTEVGQLRVMWIRRSAVTFFIHRACLTTVARRNRRSCSGSVDVDAAGAISGHHTVTHLLHWATAQGVSAVTRSQKGSYVGPDKLTFDFFKRTTNEAASAGRGKIVTRRSRRMRRSHGQRFHTQKRKSAVILSILREKYATSVRVLQIAVRLMRSMVTRWNCVAAARQIDRRNRPIPIVKEEAIAAGVRRIEAVAGDAGAGWAYRRKRHANRRNSKLWARKN